MIGSRRWRQVFDHGKALQFSAHPYRALTEPKKSPLTGSGLNLFPWRRIEETGSMMLQRGKLVQFIFQMTAIKNIDKAALSTAAWCACDAWDV